MACLQLERRDAEKEEQLKRLADELARAKQQQGHRSASGPIHPNERSSDSISTHSGSQNSLAQGSRDLEGMSREQLIKSCRHEIVLKEQAVAKLLEFVKARGISEQQPQSKSRKHRNEIRRVEELMEQKHQQEMDHLKANIRDLSSNVHFLTEQLYEEQERVKELEGFLKEAQVSVFFNLLPLFVHILVRRMF